ncbi:MAG TPA: aldo/keto reductase, partial [Polyangiaceae bacterium]
MKRQPFGNTDLVVSPFGIGCARIGGVFQGDTRGHLDLLAAARAAGINFFDTADMYSQGESEKLVGRAFRGVRDRVIIATKAGYCLPGRRRLLARLKPLLRPLVRLAKIRRDRLPAAVRGTIVQDFSPSYLKRAVEASLRRLRTDYIDLLQLHSPPLEVVERGEWQSALEELKRRGQIRYYGISCDSVDVGLAALRYPGVSSVQFLLNLLETGAAETLAPRLADAKIAGVARECLANGLLVKERHEIELAKY